jgi:hypothetical protein
VIESCTFEQFNLKFLNFDSIFQVIEVDLINDLSKYSLIPAKKITRDIKKLFYHHVFYGISEYLLHNKSRERVIILKTKITDINSSAQILQYFNKEEVEKCIDQAVKQVARLLPIGIYGYDNNIFFKNLKTAYKERNGEVVELVERIRTFAWSHDFMRSHYTFAKVKNFAKRNNLTFLSEKYFNQLKTKQLLFA